MKLKKSLAVILSVSLITSINATAENSTKSVIQNFLNDHKKELVAGGVAVTTLGGGILIGYNCKKCDPYAEVQKQFKNRINIFSNAPKSIKKYEKHVDKIENKITKLNQKIADLDAEKHASKIEKINNQIQKLNSLKAVYKTALTLDTNEKALNFVKEYRNNFLNETEIKELIKKVNNTLRSNYREGVTNLSGKATAKIQKVIEKEVAKAAKAALKAEKAAAKAARNKEDETPAAEAEGKTPTKSGSWPRGFFKRRGRK